MSVQIGLYMHLLSQSNRHSSSISILSFIIDATHLVKSGITDITGIIRGYRHVIDNMHIKDIV
jgi:hypothetical protein